MQEIGKLDQKQIDALKAKHGDVYLVTVKDDAGDLHHCYLKKPGLDILSASAKYAETDPIKSGLVMYNSLKLHVSDVIEQQDEYKMGVISKLGELFKIREAEIKKL